MDNFIKTIRKLFSLDPRIIDLNSGANCISYFLLIHYLQFTIIFILGQYKRFSKILVHIAHLVYILDCFFVQLHCTPNYILNTAYTPAERLRCFISYLLPTTVWVACKRKNRETKKKHQLLF